jgi:hypothetical protein
LFIRQRIKGGDIDERVKRKKGRHDKGKRIDSSGRHWDNSEFIMNYESQRREEIRRAA